MIAEADLEFVTNGTHVKYFWAWVKLSKNNTKNFPNGEILLNLG